MKAVKIVFGVLAGVVILLIAAAVLVASFFDPNDYKGYVTDAFTARTGRTLEIAQDLKLSFFPWLAVQTGGITIGNAPGFGEEPFATVERAAARVQLMPLLERQIKVGTVELDGLTLNLARSNELVGNWQDLLDAARSPADGDAGGQPSDPAQPQSFELAGIEIENGTVTWRENTTELRYTLSGLSLSTGALGGGGPVELDLALQFRDELTARQIALEAKGSVELAAGNAIAVRGLTTEITLNEPGRPQPITAALTVPRAEFDAAAQTLLVEGLTADAGGIRAAIDVRGTGLGDSPVLEGTIAARDSPIAAVFELLGAAPPNGVDPSMLGHFDLQAAVHVRPEPLEITVSSLEVRALGMTATGAVALDAARTLTGRLAIPEFTPTASFFALVQPVASADVDLTALDKLALSLGFDMNLDSGRASFSDLQLTALGATVNASLEVVPGARGTAYRGAFTTSRFTPDAAARIFGNMLPDTLAVDELGMVALDTRFAYDEEQDNVTLAPFKAEVFGLVASGRVTGSNLSWNPSWAGEAQVAQFSPQELITRFGLPPQPTSDPRALTRATIDTSFTIDQDRARFANLVLALDDSRITGDFTVDGFSDPQYLFTLAIDGVDADRYLPPKARDAEEGEATAGDIELPQNNTMRMDGRMTIGQLTLAGMSFQDVGSRILLGGGDAKLEGARARLYGGEFAGNFHVKAAGDAPGLALDGQASGLQLQPLIEALTGEPANFSGTGRFDLDLAGRGRTVIENVQTAGGNVSFEMVAGAIKGFNLGRTLCAAYNVTQRAPAPPELPAETAYEAIKGTATVSAGTATSSDLLARTSFMDINGAGSLQLVNQELDYELDAKLTGPIAIENCATLDPYVGNALPFDIRGTVTSPRITPDFSKLVQRALREEVQERLQERLQDRLRDLLR
jgi:AsmA protein